MTVRWNNYVPSFTPSVHVVEVPRYALWPKASLQILQPMQLMEGIENVVCSLNITAFNDQNVCFLNATLNVDTLAMQKVTILREWNSDLMTQNIVVGIELYLYVNRTDAEPIERSFSDSWSLTLPWNPNQ